MAQNIPSVTLTMTLGSKGLNQIKLQPGYDTQKPKQQFYQKH